MTQEMVKQLADVTRDWQWIHIDPERAESAYGTTIAHSFLTLSLLPYLVEMNSPSYERVKLGVNNGLNKVRFPHAVPVGAKIRARTTLQSFQEVKGG